MASLDATKVGVGSGKVTGAIFVAPNTEALPTDATTALSANYKCIGYTSYDGVTVSESSSSNVIRAWEGLVPVYTTISDYTEQVQITPIQIDSDAYKLVWGDSNVTDDGLGNITISHTSAVPASKSCVIEMVERSNIVHRLCATIQPASRDSVTYNGRDVSGRRTTFNCLADSSGVTMHEYIAIS